MSRGVTEAMDILAGLKVEIDLLLMAVKAEDPYSELRVRVADLRAGAHALTAALAAEPGAAEGKVLVPREITAEMAHALESNIALCLPPSEVHRANWAEAYRNMLAAAPRLESSNG